MRALNLRQSALSELDGFQYHALKFKWAATVEPEAFAGTETTCAASNQANP